MFEVEKSRIKLTVSADVAVAISEVTKCFENEAFDDWEAADVMEVLYAIADKDKSVVVYPLGDCTRPTAVEIEIEN